MTCSLGWRQTVRTVKKLVKILHICFLVNTSHVFCLLCILLTLTVYSCLWRAGQTWMNGASQCPCEFSIAFVLQRDSLWWGIFVCLFVLWRKKWSVLLLLIHAMCNRYITGELTLEKTTRRREMSVGHHLFQFEIGVNSSCLTKYSGRKEGLPLTREYYSWRAPMEQLTCTM